MSLQHLNPQVLSLADRYRGNPIEGSQEIMKYVLRDVVRQTGAPYFAHTKEVAQETYKITGNQVDFFKGMFHDSIEDGQFSPEQIRVIAQILFEDLKSPSSCEKQVLELERLTHDKYESYPVYLNKIPQKKTWERRRTSIVKLADTNSNTNPYDIFDREVAAQKYDKIRNEVPRNRQRGVLEKKLALSPVWAPKGLITQSIFVDRQEDLFYKKLQRNATENFTTVIPLFENYLIREQGIDKKGRFSEELATSRTQKHYNLNLLNHLFDDLARRSFTIWMREGHNIDYFYEKILEIGHHRGKKDPIGFSSVLDRINFVDLYFQKLEGSKSPGRLFN